MKTNEAMAYLRDLKKLDTEIYKKKVKRAQILKQAQEELQDFLGVQVDDIDVEPELKGIVIEELLNAKR